MNLHFPSSGKVVMITQYVPPMAYSRLLLRPDHISTPKFVMTIAGTTALQARVFAAAVACLEDGSPDARACGRKLLRLLHDQIIQAAAFKDLSDKRPKGQQLKIQKVMYLDGQHLYHDCKLPFCFVAAAEIVHCTSISCNMPYFQHGYLCMRRSSAGRIALVRMQ
jgi:hypothetical protein